MEHRKVWFQLFVFCVDLVLNWGQLYHINLSGFVLALSLSLCAGDPAAALRLTSQLISLGADVSLRSRWTNMNALHYAAYFDVPELIRVLLKATKPRGTYTHSTEQKQSIPSDFLSLKVPAISVRRYSKDWRSLLLLCSPQ